MFKRVKITKDNANNPGLKELYEKAFPEGEVAPYDKFIELLDILDMDYIAYYDGDTLIGMTVAILMKNYNYGANMAVVENLRGKGYGQKILSDALERYKSKPFLMEVESPKQLDAPNLEIRKRRYAFYLRNGIVDTGRYFTLNGVEYNIITTSKEPVAQEDIDAAFDYLKPLSERVPKTKQ